MTDTDADKNVIQFELGAKRERIVAGVGQLFDTDELQKNHVQPIGHVSDLFTVYGSTQR